MEFGGIPDLDRIRLRGKGFGTNFVNLDPLRHPAQTLWMYGLLWLKP